LANSNLAALIGSIFEINNPRDLGPLLVSSFALRPFATGLAVLRLGDLEGLEALTIIGSAATIGILPPTLFENHPVSRSIRFNSLTTANLGELSVYSSPISKGEIPLGALVVTGQIDDPEPDHFKDVHEVLCSVIGGVFRSYFSPHLEMKRGDRLREPLSLRQLIILEGFRDGLINDQIANSLLISSSTVRQESIKIFRHLGVSSRNSAALRALELGLISDLDTPYGPAGRRAVSGGDTSLPQAFRRSSGTLHP